VTPEHSSEHPSERATAHPPEHPPEAAPPVVLTLDYRRDPAPPAEGAERVGERLHVRATAGDVPRGVPADPATYRDVLLDTRLTLVAGGDDTVYGVYLRQGAGDRYVGWGMTPRRRVFAGVVVDGGWHTMLDADLDAGLPFAEGIGGTNRFQVVAVGPSLVLVLNGAVVGALSVDARFAEGHLGYWVLRGQQAEEAVVAVDWLQLRAVLPG
jgi:hypothetical protein